MSYMIMCLGSGRSAMNFVGTLSDAVAYGFRDDRVYCVEVFGVCGTLVSRVVR